MQSSVRSWSRGNAILCFAVFVSLSTLRSGASFAEEAHLLFTSDQHYGTTRKEFRGVKNADAGLVNEAMVEAINSLAGSAFPMDCGVMAGRKIPGFEYFISGGDIANRMEGTNPAIVQTAARSWELYEKQYFERLTLKTAMGDRSEILTIPGNHDFTNAIGFHRTMTPAIDKTAMLKMYEKAYGEKLPEEDFDPRRHIIFLDRDLAGIKLYFIQMWPDSAMRRRLSHEIAALPKGTPVILFTHIQPDIDANRLINPNGDHGVNATDKFENLVADISSVRTTDQIPVAERRALVQFIKEHPSIIAYFHGHEHENIFYLWRGPDGDIALPTFMVDSPMRGKVSGEDESKISFHSIAVDSDSRKVTVRQVLWNFNPVEPAIRWGDSMTFSY